MGTHIIWRNPSPPQKREFKLRRAGGNDRLTFYQAVGPRYRNAFELVHWPGCSTILSTKTADAIATPFGGELVLARW